MHLLLYYVFVSSASNLVHENPFYAVVAIGFLVPGEKFFRKMFGFDKASSAGQLGAAASGALIMNAVNKMGQKAGRAASEKDGSGGSAPGSVRTASANGVSVGSGAGGSLPGGNTPGGNTPGGNASGGNIPGGNASVINIPGGGVSGRGRNTPGGMASAGNIPGGNVSGGTVGNLGTTRSPSVFGPTVNRAISNGNIKQGAMAVGRKYFNVNTGKKVRTMARKGLVGAAGAATLGTVGLAAGVASGDAGNAFKYSAAGLGAGYIGANRLTDRALSGNIRETFKEGAIRQNEYNNLKADKQFYASNEFRNMVNNHDLLPGKTGKGRTAEMRRQIQTYRDSGITDTSKISTAMKTGLSAQEGAYAVKLAGIIGRSGWNDPKTRKDFERRYRSAIPGPNGDKIWNSIEKLL